jgi:transcriptional regulator with XRE-family HTH domain
MSNESIKNNYNEQLKALGDGLKKLRKERGYSNYHKLAYDMDMIHSQYGAYENGKNITMNTLLRILDFHNITLKEFVNQYLDAAM